MPVYEYRCSGGHFYEKSEGFDAPNRHRCPDCGKLARRQISVPAVIFKGSGFYSTDNRSGQRRNGGSESDKSETAAQPETDGQSHGDGAGHSHDGEGGHPAGSVEPKVKASVE